MQNQPASNNTNDSQPLNLRGVFTTLILPTSVLVVRVLKVVADRSGCVQMELFKSSFRRNTTTPRFLKRGHPYKTASCVDQVTNIFHMETHRKKLYSNNTYPNQFWAKIFKDMRMKKYINIKKIHRLKNIKTATQMSKNIFAHKHKKNSGCP